MSRMNATLGRARGLLAGFTPGQRGVVAVAVVGLVVAAFALSRWAAQPTWTPLYSGLSGTDASAIVEQLQAQGVEYQLAAGGTTVLVPQSQVYDLRVSLAGQGLEASDGEGWSILDSQGMTATDFQQNVAYRRALESELSKTLQAIDGVDTAIVRLAMPKKDVFTTEQDRPTASVLLDLAPGTDLSDEQVNAVTALVSGGVEGLKPGDVNVTDNKGRVLSSPADGANGAASRASRADDQTARYEARMSSKAQKMLDDMLGPGKAVVQVNAQLDFDTRETTSKRYVREDPAPQALSQTTSREGYVNATGQTGGQLGVTWPELDQAAAGENGGKYLKETSTVDNAVGEIVDRVQAQPGAVERLTVAVVLDEKAAANVDPARVQALVSNAVGIDPARGDTVQVDRMAFDTTSAAAAQKELEAAAAAERTAGYIDLGKKVGIGLLVLIGLVLLTRRRKSTDASVEATASDLPESSLLLPGGETPALTSTPVAALPMEPEVDEAAERDRMRHDVAQLVDSQPDEVAAVIQGWLSERKS